MRRDFLALCISAAGAPPLGVEMTSAVEMDARKVRKLRGIFCHSTWKVIICLLYNIIYTYVTYMIYHICVYTGANTKLCVDMMKPNIALASGWLASKDLCFKLRQDSEGAAASGTWGESGSVARLLRREGLEMPRASAPSDLQGFLQRHHHFRAFGDRGQKR